MSKYIFISGGVISGIGKGISAASIGLILKSYGKKITMIKADPYLNVDAGTMNPLEHGETFVLEDGFETDMDMGTYERFVNESFKRENSLTGGAILEKVIKGERALEYNGKWISLDYHAPMAIVDWFKQVSKETKSDVTIIEIGGTVGEMGNALFLEANRMLKLMYPQDVIHIHVAYFPIPSKLGEMKSKPAQMSIQELTHHGIQPDFVIARSEVPVDDVRIEKIEKYSFVKKENVIPAPDEDCIYDIPVNFDKYDIGRKLLKSLGLRGTRNELLDNWKKKTNKIKKLKREINIGIVGKYYKSGAFDLQDSYVSVLEAIKHASWELGIHPNIHWFVADDLKDTVSAKKELESMDGIIVPQGWGSRGSEGKINAIKIAREKKIPYLGLCYGMQMAVVEFARDVLDLKDANSEEIDPKSKNKVIHLMDSQKENVKLKNYGGTIRLGGYPCKLKDGSLLASLYSKYNNELYNKLPIVIERHRHRYEFNNEYRDIMEKAGLVLSGSSPDGNLIEAIELPTKVHPFFVGTQYHPELKTRFIEPHPIFLGFVNACLKKAK